MVVLGATVGRDSSRRDAGRWVALMPTRFSAPRWHGEKRRCTHCERACRNAFYNWLGALEPLARGKVGALLAGMQLCSALGALAIPISK